MKYDFENALYRGGPDFDVRTRDTVNFLNLAFKEIEARAKDGRIIRLGIPVGAWSDGVSDPQIARDLDPSLRFRIFVAGFAHDSAFRKTLVIYVDGTGWVNADLDEDDSNTLIRALMMGTDSTPLEREIVYKMLVWFGGRAFREDRSIEART